MSTLEETHMIGLNRSLLQYYLKHRMLHVYGGQEACRRVVDNALVRPIGVSSSFPVASILLKLISTRAGKNVGLEKCFYVFLCFLTFFYRFFVFFNVFFIDFLCFSCFIVAFLCTLLVLRRTIRPYSGLPLVKLLENIEAKYLLITADH